VIFRIFPLFVYVMFITNCDLIKPNVIREFEGCVENAQAGDGHVDRIHKFKAWDKVRALEMLARYFGFFEENVQHQGCVRASGWRYRVTAMPTSANAGRYGYFSRPDAVIPYSTVTSGCGGPGGNCFRPCLAGRPVTE
jgi:hypothetical protein